MTVFKVFGGRGTVGVRGMTVFKVFGGRGTAGVRGMTGFKVLKTLKTQFFKVASAKQFVAASQGLLHLSSQTLVRFAKAGIPNATFA